jgi:hypothetical protein
MICMNLKSHIINLKVIVCLGLLLVTTHLFSQQSKDTAKSATPVKHKILLIPFKSTMMMSEIGKAVNASTHLTYAKITAAFRSSLDLALNNTFKQSYATKSLLQTNKKTDTILTYIYNSIGYNYDIVPGTDTAGESHAEFDPKLQKTHFIKNGKLEVPMDYTKRFMNTHVLDPDLLSELNKMYGADIFVFINELDIKNVANTPTEDLTASNFRREVIVQYTILNTQKHYLAEGVLITYFPNNVNDPKVIGENYFTVIAQDMLKELEKGLQKPQPAKTKKPINHTKATTNKN